MFINVPTDASLIESSLKLYFTAWTSLLEILSDFQDVYGCKLYPDENAEDNEFPEEKAEYIKRCGYELQLICNHFQQSNELALKAKVTQVSPYLLLTGYESALKGNVEEHDFSDFRTVDAKDLPRIVNAVSGQALSQVFIQGYEKLRKQRNKIIHLGYSEELNAKKLIEEMIDNYIELWPDRHWLQDRLTFLSATRTSHFQEHTSPEGNILDNIGWEFQFFSPAKFRKLFKVNSNEVTYLCPSCFTEAKTDANDPMPETAMTAFKKEEDQLHCLMCQRDYTLQAQNCSNGNCEGAVAFSHEESEPFCCLCGILLE